jgi:hypothetical protein
MFEAIRMIKMFLNDFNVVRIDATCSICLFMTRIIKMFLYDLEHVEPTLHGKNVSRLFNCVGSNPHD